MAIINHELARKLRRRERAARWASTAICALLALLAFMWAHEARQAREQNSVPTSAERKASIINELQQLNWAWEGSHNKDQRHLIRGAALERMKEVDFALPLQLQWWVTGLVNTLPTPAYTDLKP
jgi:hypothetical protein